VSYLSASTHQEIIPDPSKVETYYVQLWKRFATDLGSADFGLVLGASILPVAFAAIIAWDLKPYGPEKGVTLPEILASPSIACDNYVRLAWYLTGFMPQVSWVPAKIVALGWNGGAVGNHAQMLVSDGTNSLLIDPTIGLVVRGVTFDTLMQGKPVSPTMMATFESFNVYAGSSGTFTQTVKNAVLQGKYKPSDLLYYVKSLDQFTHMPANAYWLTPQA
jgi:hypothetical protein